MTYKQPRIVYSSEYDFTLWGYQPATSLFDGGRPSGALQIARERYGGNRLECLLVAPAAPVTDAELALVHTADYLRDTAYGPYVVGALEWPLPAWLALSLTPLLSSRVVSPMRWAVAGTRAAAQLAVDGHNVINLSGGFHHASEGRGEGFCLFADVAYAIRSLRKTGELGPSDRVVIIDLDAHQGNGLQRIFVADPSILFLDVYNRDIYPQDEWAATRIDWPVPIASGICTDGYLDRLRSELASAAEGFADAKLAFYIAGSDVSVHDRLGRLSITDDGIRERDRTVLTTLAALHLPTVVLPGGGYSGRSRHLLAQTIDETLRTTALSSTPAASVGDRVSQAE